MEQQANQSNENHDFTGLQEWDPRAMLKSMSFLEQKIHQLRELVRIIVDHRSLAGIQGSDLSIQQQQLITTDLSSIIIQLISTAGSLLPTVKHQANPPTKQLEQFGGASVPSETGTNVGALTCNGYVPKAKDQLSHVDQMGECFVDEHEAKDEDEPHEEENLPPGSYEILQLEKEEILAPHTHFCTICGKGFKRDANLRMHMRGHGDEYKTSAALIKPQKDSSSGTTLIKRRTHCEKRYACSRCNLKKFSVIADLRTHEKHCGKDKWLCSCGTTFSRKDKLFGHISLFQGHTPAIPLDETKGFAQTSNQGQTNDATTKAGNIDFEVNVQNDSGLQNTMNVKGSTDNQAMQQYEMAIAYMGDDFMFQLFGKFRDMALAVKNPCHLNMAACLLKLQRYDEAIAQCSIVLAEEENNVKALFRRGKARSILGQTDAAREDFLKARKLAPQDKAITRELNLIAEHEKAVYKKQKELYKGLFGPRPEPKPKSRNWLIVIWQWLLSLFYTLFRRKTPKDD